VVDSGYGDGGLFAEVAECGDLGFGFEPGHEPAGDTRDEVLMVDQRN
jgi:hypothetical protein